jgi:hypothetical protein
MDNILLVGTSDGIANVKNMTKPLYKMKDLGHTRLFLGIEIDYLSDSRIKLSQTRYIKKLLECFRMTGCNTTHLLMKRDLQESDNLLSDNEITDYQALVGGLN